MMKECMPCSLIFVRHLTVLRGRRFGGFGVPLASRLVLLHLSLSCTMAWVHVSSTTALLTIASPCVLVCGRARSRLRPCGIYSFISLCRTGGLALRLVWGAHAV